MLNANVHSPPVPASSPLLLPQHLNFILFSKADQYNVNSSNNMASSNSRSSTACGPWKLLRFVFRVVLFGALVWFILALLWAFLPTPTTEHDGDNGSNYATAQLRAGKTLTRVYK
jgi:hypothetical protein